ncbi:MAG: signal peptidase II [Nanoarchaeota archaeon]
MKKYLPFFLVAAGIVAIDQASKAAILASIPFGEKLWLIKGVLSFTPATNTGAAFGIFTGQNLILLIIGIAVLAALIYFLPKLQRPMLLPAGLIAGGILGNVIDRIVRGAVTDFIDLQVWPVFNAADSALCVGVAILVLQNYLTDAAKR